MLSAAALPQGYERYWAARKSWGVVQVMVSVLFLMYRVSYITPNDGAQELVWCGVVWCGVVWCGVV